MYGVGSSYTLRTTTSLSFAVARIRGSSPAEGFAVLSEIDVQATHQIPERPAERMQLRRLVAPR